jgi:hypothetical protein
MFDSVHPQVVDGFRVRRCVRDSAELGEPMEGTAPVASAWIALEQPGAWGANALLQSGLDRGLGRLLTARATAAGVRVQLIRRPGRHPNRPGGRRRVLFAYSGPGEAWLEAGEVDDPRTLLHDLDLNAIAAGIRPRLGWAQAEPLLLLCTHARRDVCCASESRPVLQTLLPTYAERLWETSHLGGHRFAPTAVVLPTGYVYGGLTPLAARDVLTLAAHDEVALAGLRGRSPWAPAGQLADIAVRRATGEVRAGALRVSGIRPVSDEYLVVTEHVDGRRWKVAVGPAPNQVIRATGCGLTPTLSNWLRVVRLRQVHGATAAGRTRTA